MLLGVPKELKEFERRVALSPAVVKQIVAAGYRVLLETGAGEESYFSDQLYQEAGAEISPSAEQVYKTADIVLKVNAPSVQEIALMKKSATLISFMWATSSPEIVEACAQQGITSFSIDAIPRISRAQKMDALSSQSNLAGYKTVILGANHLGKMFPLMMTAAGTIKPSKVLIMGAGVAGLQAIATAKRMGAIVEVSDIRPETKEQVESLGGKFISVEGESGLKTEGGYVKEISKEYLEKQKQLVTKHISDADLVITTALVPGKKAPLLITADMVKSMKAGSVIVDMAVEQGGNCELSELNKTVVKEGIIIVGESNLPSLLPVNASELYARNIQTFLFHISDKDELKIDLEDEITAGSMITHQGEAVHPSVKGVAV